MANPPDAASGSKAYSFGASMNSSQLTIGSITSGAFPSTVGESRRQAVQNTLDAAFGVGRVTVSNDPFSSDFTISFSVTANICNGSACTVSSATVLLHFNQVSTATPTPIPTQTPGGP